MFTGLVEGTGIVEGIRRVGGDVRLTVKAPFDVSECRLGDSVCVSGVCLTVTAVQGGRLSMDVSGETLSRSTLERLRKGDQVNLERALRLSDRLGGHLVSGHVDGLGIVADLQPRQRSRLMTVAVGPGISRYVVEKGSIAVDGVSLTINRCEAVFFDVNIIPHTGSETTLLQRKKGDAVNIETDMIGKYVERFLMRRETDPEKPRAPGIDLDMLRRHGFGD